MSTNPFPLSRDADARGNRQVAIGLALSFTTALMAAILVTVALLTLPSTVPTRVANTEQAEQHVAQRTSVLAARETVDYRDSFTVYAYTPRGAVNDKGITEEVLSRLSPTDRGKLRKYGNDLATVCHEGTHFVKSDISEYLAHNGDPRDGFYIGNGKAIILSNPRVSRQQVIAQIGRYRNDMLFRLYFLQQAQSWNVCGCAYFMDEYVAMVNGLEALTERGIRGSKMQFELDMCRKFNYFADCYLQAIRRNDPHYRDLDELQAFVNWEKKRVERLVR